MPCRGPVGLEHDRVNLDRVVRPRRASLHQRVEPRDDDTPDHEIVHPAGRTEVRTRPRGHGDDREPPPYSGHSLRRMVRLGEQPQRRLQGRGTGAGGRNIALHDPLFQDRTFQQARRERTPGHVHDSRGDRLPPAADRLHERCRNMDSREGHDHGRRHSRGPARQLPHGDVGRRPTAGQCARCVRIPADEKRARDGRLAHVRGIPLREPEGGKGRRVQLPGCGRCRHGGEGRAPGGG